LQDRVSILHQGFKSKICTRIGFKNLPKHNILICCVFNILNVVLKNQILKFVFYKTVSFKQQLLSYSPAYLINKYTI
jgi:hypothetical protein